MILLITLKEKKWRNSRELKSYRKFSYEPFWNKRLDCYKSYEIPLEWHLFYSNFGGILPISWTVWKVSFVSFSLIESGCFIQVSFHSIWHGSLRNNAMRLLTETGLTGHDARMLKYESSYLDQNFTMHALRRLASPLISLAREMVTRKIRFYIHQRPCSAG